MLKSAVIDQFAGIGATLPLRARNYFLRLREHRDDAHAALMEISRKRNEILISKQKIQIRLDQFKNPHAYSLAFTALPADDPQCLSLVKDLADIAATHERLDRAYQEREEAWNAWASLADNLEKWINGKYSADAFVEADAPPVTVRKGQSGTEAIEQRRRRIREIDADLHTIRSAPRPAADVKSQARKEIEALAARGRPDCFAMLEQGAPINFPMQQMRAQIQSAKSPGFAAWSQPDAIAIFAWLHRDEIICALDKEIDILADDANALTDEQRIAREQTAQSDLLANEREEEALCQIAEDQFGAAIRRRPDANPLAVLGLAPAVAS